MIPWLAFMAVLGFGGVLYSVANPPSEPVYHCIDPVTEKTVHQYSACPNTWLQYNLGDAKSALDLHLHNIIEGIH